MNIFGIIGDIATDVPDLQKAIPVMEAVFAEIKAGKMPNITPQDMMLVEKLVADVKKLLADIK